MFRTATSEYLQYSVVGDRQHIDRAPVFRRSQRCALITGHAECTVYFYYSMHAAHPCPSEVESVALMLASCSLLVLAGISGIVPVDVSSVRGDVPPAAACEFEIVRPSGRVRSVRTAIVCKHDACNKAKLFSDLQMDLFVDI
jgi:hypothetical protein